MTRYDHPFHRAAAAAVGHPGGHGAPTAIAKRLGVRPDSYARALDRDSAGTLLEWAARLRIVAVQMTAEDGAPVYIWAVGPDDLVAASARLRAYSFTWSPQN